MVAAQSCQSLTDMHVECAQAEQTVETVWLRGASQSSSAAAEYSHDIFPRIKRDMGKTAKALGALQPSSAQFSVCPNHAAKPYRVFNPYGKIVVNLKRTCTQSSVNNCVLGHS